MITWFSAWERVAGSAAVGPTSPHEHRAMTGHLLPAIGSWQGMLSSRFQDALILSHASAGIHHPIEESCGHPAVMLRWPHRHTAAWAVCKERDKKPLPLPSGSQTSHDAREVCSVKEKGKTFTVRKSHCCTCCIAPWDFLKPSCMSQWQCLHKWIPEASLVLFWILGNPAWPQ